MKAWIRTGPDRSLEEPRTWMVGTAMFHEIPGNGEALFAGIDLPAPGYSVTEHAATDATTHTVLTK